MSGKQSRSVHVPCEIGCNSYNPGSITWPNVTASGKLQALQAVHIPGLLIVCKVQVAVHETEDNCAS